MKNVKYSSMKDWMYLLAGVIITVLYLVFATPIYELMYYDAEFSNEMYNENMYFCGSRDHLTDCMGALLSSITGL